MGAAVSNNIIQVTATPEQVLAFHTKIHQLSVRIDQLSHEEWEGVEIGPEVEKVSAAYHQLIQEHAASLLPKEMGELRGKVKQLERSQKPLVERTSGRTSSGIFDIFTNLFSGLGSVAAIL
jgi:hypothetical protein